MKLCALDKENIEVLEALDLDENALLKLICRYFAYRCKRIDGRFGDSPNVALEATIRWHMDEEEVKR